MPKPMSQERGGLKKKKKILLHVAPDDTIGAELMEGGEVCQLMVCNGQWFQFLISKENMSMWEYVCVCVCVCVCVWSCGVEWGEL